MQKVFIVPTLCHQFSRHEHFIFIWYRYSRLSADDGSAPSRESRSDYAPTDTRCEVFSADGERQTVAESDLYSLVYRDREQPRATFTAYERQWLRQTGVQVSEEPDARLFGEVFNRMLHAVHPLGSWPSMASS